MPYVTYFCPRCNFLNASEHYQESPRRTTRVVGSTGGESGEKGGVFGVEDPTIALVREVEEKCENEGFVESKEPIALMQGIIGDDEGERK